MILQWIIVICASIIPLLLLTVPRLPSGTVNQIAQPCLQSWHGSRTRQIRQVFPGIRILNGVTEDWKRSEFMLLSDEFHRPVLASESQSFGFSSILQVTSQSHQFFFRLSQPVLASVACKQRTLTETTLQRHRYRHILIKVCLYYVLIIQVTNIKLKSVSQKITSC